MSEKQSEKIIQHLRDIKIILMIVGVGLIITLVLLFGGRF